METLSSAASAAGRPEPDRRLDITPWTPAFRAEYRARGISHLGIDIEEIYQAFLTDLLGPRARDVHERSMAEQPRPLSYRRILAA